MAIIRDEYWTEDALLVLPPGEDDNFGRKAGTILNDESRLRAELGKQLSAFANSGGGHVFIGVDDKGVVDGVPRAHKLAGRMTTLAWLEDLIPNLTDYPLRRFRVQEITPSATSNIPHGQVVIAIDVHDSDLAPHQNKADHIYYSRQGGKSRPAQRAIVKCCG